MFKKYIFLIYFLCLLAISPPIAASYSNWPNNFGQLVEINTFFNRWVGKPSWLLLIRDLDHNQNIPYVFDLYRGNNTWVAFTYGHHYQILSSQMTFNPYDKVINNFCGLESLGLIQGESLRVVILGSLTPDKQTFKCNVIKFPDASFSAPR